MEGYLRIKIGRGLTVEINNGDDWLVADEGCKWSFHMDDSLIDIIGLKMEGLGFDIHTIGFDVDWDDVAEGKDPSEICIYGDPILGCWTYEVLANMNDEGGHVHEIWAKRIS